MEKNNLIINRRLASNLSALAIMLSFIFFIAGYFVGKRHMANDFFSQLKEESLTDQVYSSISNLYETPKNKDKVLLDIQETQELLEENEVSVPYKGITKNSNENQLKGSLYYAQLASFRRLQDAQPLVQRLKKHGITTNIKEITSKSRQGRTIKWFQVITKNYRDKDSLNLLIKTIKNFEKINDIIIKKENKS